MVSKPQLHAALIAIIAVTVVAFINSQVNIPVVGAYLPGGSKF